MELNPVVRVQNSKSINWSSEHMAARNGSMFWHLILQASAPPKPKVPVIQNNNPPAAERQLRKKYPGLVYNICDASSPYWKTESNYPHELIFQPNLRAELLENWKPDNAALNLSVNPGSKAVAVHPEAAERMENDYVFAYEVMKRIDMWFTFDTARNEAVKPGSSMGLSQGAAVGADGSITNVVSIPADGKNGEISPKDWYAVLWREQHIRNNEEVSRQYALMQQYSILNTTQAAAAQLAMMLNSGEFQSILGTTVAGVSTEDVVRETKKKVWGVMD